MTTSVSKYHQALLIATGLSPEDPAAVGIRAAVLYDMAAVLDHFGDQLGDDDADPVRVANKMNALAKVVRDFANHLRDRDREAKRNDNLS
jgi:hypothetical protein